MKRRSITLASIALAAATAASAQTAPAPRLAAVSRLELDGQSSVRPFTCKARNVQARTGEGKAAGAPLDERLKTLVSGAQLEIAAKQLDCGDPAMNDHMYKALKADEHRHIRFRITGYELNGTSSTEVPVKLQGELTLGGRTVPIVVSAKATATPTGGVRLQGAHLLRMTDWGVTPPSLFFGALKVRDSVVIRFDLAADAVAIPPVAGI